MRGEKKRRRMLSLYWFAKPSYIYKEKKNTLLRSVVCYLLFYEWGKYEFILCIEIIWKAALDRDWEGAVKAELGQNL